MTKTSTTWLAIVNPLAGQSRRHSWPAVERELRAAGVPIDVEFTKEAHDGEGIARDAVLNERRRLLVVGGDGSVHDIVNGIMSVGSLHREVTLAVAPLGTGNDWARSLGMDLSPRELAAAITSDRTMQHDVGVIDFPEAVPARRRWFVNVAGAGFDSYVIGRLPSHVPSPLAYLWGALTGLASYRAPRLRISLDGEIIERRLLLAFVANAQSCGNGMLVAPVARVDDGLLDLVMVDEVGWLSAMFKIVRLYRGTVLDDPVVRHRRTMSARLDAEPPIDIEAEGQIVGRTPAVFSILLGALRVVTTKEMMSDQPCRAFAAGGGPAREPPPDL